MRNLVIACALFPLAVPAAAVAEQAQPSSPLRVVFNSTGGGDGRNRLTVDVFWCDGDTKAQSRALSASELAGSLAAVSSLVPEVGSQINQIRTRPIDREVFLSNFAQAISKSGTEKAIVRFDLHDKRTSRIVDEFGKASIYMKNANDALDSHTPNYISTYLCQDVSPSQYAGQLYVQVQSPDQKGDALKAMSGLAKTYPGVAIASGIEVVGDRSPSTSELRYFLDKDRGAAKIVADNLSANLKTPITTKFVAGYEEKIRPGTLEAWIARKGM